MVGQYDFLLNRNFNSFLVKGYLTLETNKSSSYEDSFQIILWILEFRNNDFTDSPQTTTEKDIVLPNWINTHWQIIFSL